MSRPGDLTGPMLGRRHERHAWKRRDWVGCAGTDQLDTPCIYLQLSREGRPACLCGRSLQGTSLRLQTPGKRKLRLKLSAHSVNIWAGESSAISPKPDPGSWSWPCSRQALRRHSGQDFICSPQENRGI